jgi:hypothetical protein
MKRLTLLIIILSLLFAAQPSSGQSGEEKITAAFFSEFKNDPPKAYEDLFVNSKWMKDKKNNVKNMKMGLKDFLKDLGDYEGYEFITEKKIGENYVLKSFLVKYERQPIRFSFLLYRPIDTWQMQNFIYDTDIENELTESSKIYRLNNSQ